ncbi:hypothetical protein BC939DRAFT_77174 [Gamsiella multidivaricata]|uniref:uncharacterized protein n=1 Tax=Gamsiella multidivaricata TaxID=101098 RepID=UPI00221ED0FE|nr:uncharacterized protein BC939DRAFT_77174 [Gamsiella multidivaricata]KAI7828006.1 hypothetical protein BC939DRAFT_77174 [Gamsiella multidivaricata]
MQRFLNLVSSSPAKSVNPMDIISDSVTSSSSQDDHPNPVDSLEDLIDSLERPIHSDDNPDEDQEPDFFDHQRGIEGPGTSSTTTTTTVVVVGTSQHAEQEQERQSPSTNESNIRTIVHTLLPTGSIVTEDTLDRLSRAFEIIAKETAKATVSEAISAKISIGSRKATLKPKSAAKRGRGRPPKTGVQAGTKRAAESDEPSKAKRQKAARKGDGGSSNQVLQQRKERTGGRTERVCNT